MQFHLFAGTKGSFYDCPGAHIPEGGSHKRPSLTRLYVLELRYLKQSVVKVKCHSVLEVGCGDRHVFSFGLLSVALGASRLNNWILRCGRESAWA